MRKLLMTKTSPLNKIRLVMVKSHVENNAKLYVWTISQEEGEGDVGSITDKTGHPYFSHKFSIPGTYKVTVEMHGESGNDLGTFKGHVLCRYGALFVNCVP